jgi:hypothetical protein
MIGRVAVSVPSWSPGATGGGDSAGFSLRTSGRLRPGLSVRPKMYCGVGMYCPGYPPSKAETTCCNCNCNAAKKKKEVFYGPGQVDGE